jgi:hypothetical protein
MVRALSILIIFGFHISFCQIAGMVTRVIPSESKQYSVIVTGLAYEGFAGPQRISLIKSKNNDTIWTKTFPSEIFYPCVSNNGDVAITSGSIQVFNRDGALNGTYNPKLSPQQLGIGNSAIQSFSPSADRFYIFMQSQEDYEDAILLCLTDSAKEIWQDNLGHFSPNTFFFYRDKIIICNYQYKSLKGFKSPRTCVVLSIDDDLLLQYERINHPNFDIQFDGTNGLLHVSWLQHNELIKLDTLNAP